MKYRPNLHFVLRSFSITVLVPNPKNMLHTGRLHICTIACDDNIQEMVLFFPTFYYKAIEKEICIKQDKSISTKINQDQRRLT